MSSTKITLQNVVAKGIPLGRPTEQTKREFYDACAAYLGDKTGTVRTAAIEKIHTAGKVKHPNFPSVGTIGKFAGYAARFGELPNTVNLEVAAKFAAQAGDDATFDYVLDSGDKVSLPLRDDADAVAAVTRYIADTGIDTLSIRDAREMFGGSGSRAAAKDEPLSVGDVVDWLLSQPGAVQAYAESNRDHVGELLNLISHALMGDAVAA